MAVASVRMDRACLHPDPDALSLPEVMGRAGLAAAVPSVVARSGAQSGRTRFGNRSTHVERGLVPPGKRQIIDNGRPRLLHLQ